MSSFNTQEGFQEAKQWAYTQDAHLSLERMHLERQGLTEDEIATRQGARRAKVDDLLREIREHQDSLLGEFEQIFNLDDFGRFLVALRLAKGMTVAELASHLGSSESYVKKQEAAEYRGVPIERIRKVLDALHVHVITQIEILE